MHGDLIRPSSTHAFGKVRGYHVRDVNDHTVLDIPETRTRLLLPGWWECRGGFQSNLFLYDWAAIVAQLLRGIPGGPAFALSAMYL